MTAPVFAFGLVAFGFLGMGPVTIAVDSYGPVTDNAQSVYELSVIETIPNIKDEIKKDFGFDVEVREGQALPRGERRRRQHLQGDRQAGAHRHRRRRRHHDDLLDHRRAHRTACTDELGKLSILHPPFLLGLITGGAVIYWFTGASTQAVVDRRLPRGRVHQGEHQARRRREGVDRRLARRSSRSARSTRRRACSTSSSSVFFSHAGVRLPRAVLLHRLPDLHRALRPLPGALHGQRRRRLGQRQEGRRGRAQGEGHAAARGQRRRRHRRRSLQGHLVGGA